MQKSSHLPITVPVALTLFLVQPFGADASTILFNDVEENATMSINIANPTFYSSVSVGNGNSPCAVVNGSQESCSINLFPSNSSLKPFIVTRFPLQVQNLDFTIFIEGALEPGGGSEEGRLSDSVGAININPAGVPAGVRITFNSDPLVSPGFCSDLAGGCSPSTTLKENGEIQEAFRLFWVDANNVLQPPPPSDPEFVVVSFRSDAVPGPVVGAGLPGLILASGVLLLLARHRRQLFA